MSSLRTDQAELWWQAEDSLLAESPVWVAAEQAFFWVDIAARRIRRHDGSARPARSWVLPQKVGCIAPRAGGGWIAALQDGVYAATLPAAGGPAELSPL
ncbi:MAG TPA: SMP-30/gluconolactonase/LRE family protein, partial [Roseateles sp.]|nr:SMP-30/gluconolactonase/LRE family protein [Roseateles sp.]